LDWRAKLEEIQMIREAYLETFVTRAGSELIRKPGAVKLETPGARERWLNRTIYGESDLTEMERELKECVARANAGDFDYEWVLWPDQKVSSAKLEKLLSLYGFEKKESSECLVCDSDMYQAINSSAPVELVQVSHGDLDTFIQTAIKGWDQREVNPEDLRSRLELLFDKSRYFLVIHESRPVGCCEIQLLKDSAYLGGSSVIPSARGRGIYSRMIKERLKLAHENGFSKCTSIGLVGSSAPILQKFGFRTVGKVNFFAYFAKGGFGQ